MEFWAKGARSATWCKLCKLRTSTCHILDLFQRLGAIWYWHGNANQSLNSNRNWDNSEGGKPRFGYGLNLEARKAGLGEFLFARHETMKIDSNSFHFPLLENPSLQLRHLFTATSKSSLSYICTLFWSSHKIRKIQRQHLHILARRGGRQ